ncbi:MAG: phosphatidylglycerophosphatase A [Elusimicrobiota bacterium]
MRERALPVIDRFCVAVATGLYLSYIPFWLSKTTRLARLRRWTGAGLVGTLLGWALLYALPDGGTGFGWALSAGIVAACVVSDRADKRFGSHDDTRIIVDETVGYWAAVGWLPRDPWLLAAGFILFRVFDAGKLPPCRWLERLPGGIGVVMDDVGAGLATNLVLRGALWLHPGL